jgi:hypothetical protein
MWDERRTFRPYYILFFTNLYFLPASVTGIKRSKQKNKSNLHKITGESASPSFQAPQIQTTLSSRKTYSTGTGTGTRTKTMGMVGIRKHTESGLSSSLIRKSHSFSNRLGLAAVNERVYQNPYYDTYKMIYRLPDYRFKNVYIDST